MMVRAYPGQIAKHGQALNKNTCETLTTSKPLTAGLFVAYAEHGAKEITTAEDVVMGVIVRSLLKDEYLSGEPVDVMNIGEGDGIWVHVGTGENVKRGEKVSPIKTGAESGKVGKALNDDVFTVVEVSGDLALITKQ